MQQRDIISFARQQSISVITALLNLLQLRLLLPFYVRLGKPIVHVKNDIVTNYIKLQSAYTIDLLYSSVRKYVWGILTFSSEMACIMKPKIITN